MASIKIKLRASLVNDKVGTLYFQVIHERVARQIRTEYRLLPTEWDGKKECVVMPPVNDRDNGNRGDTVSVKGERRGYLTEVTEGLAEERAKLVAIIARLEREEPGYTADQVVSLYRESTEKATMVSYAERLIAQLERTGNTSKAERYTTSLNSFKRYMDGKDVPMVQVDSTLMQDYEAYLTEQGICRNSVSFYMRNLRAIYNRAVEEDVVVTTNPFRHVYTGIDKTVKRAMSLEDLKRLKKLDLRMNAAQELARDLFMFSFYTRGMSFVDMAKLKKSDVENGVLSYRRQKTSQQLRMKWVKAMQEIVDKYRREDSPYLLPILDCSAMTKKGYKNAYERMNKALKQVRRKLGLKNPLTTYVARHTWASVAKHRNVSLQVISEALGHDSEKTTRIYLDALDASVVDKANDMVIDALR